MQGWAVCLSSDAANKVARLRLEDRIEIQQLDDVLWLRGKELNESLESKLRSLLGARRFSVLPDLQLVAAGDRVPCGFLPDGEWTSIREYFQVELPTTQLAGTWDDAGESDAGQPCESRLQLVRCETASEATVATPNLMATSFEHWYDYATSAPQVRLKPLRYIVDSECQVVILGEPIPPIPGTRFHRVEGVAMPLGWIWNFPVDSESVRAILGVPNGGLAIVYPGGGYSILDERDFVAASRSSVRLTARRLESR
ncbi:MAG: hypothetical protein AAF497_06160 [Planctomycetota bacterium]